MKQSFLNQDRKQKELDAKFFVKKINKSKLERISKYENKRKEFENKILEFTHNVQQLNKNNSKKNVYISPKIFKSSVINKIPSLPPIKSSNRSREKEDSVNEYVAKNENSLNLNEVSIKSSKKSPYYFNDPNMAKFIDNKNKISQKRKLVNVVLNNNISTNINRLNINNILDQVNSYEDEYIIKNNN